MAMETVTPVTTPPAPSTVPPSTAAAAAGTTTPPIGLVTDKVYVEVAGLVPGTASAEMSTTQRIVFGLYGKEAPRCVAQLKQLFDTTSTGLPAPCKPLQTDFLIQREQLEANKVYRSCTETVQNVGVSYAYSQIWRIIPQERIEFGAVAGKFIAREFPTWTEAPNGPRNNKDYIVATSAVSTSAAAPSKYIMAVRRGNDSGFGFTVFANTGEQELSQNDDFLDNYIVVGKVMEETTTEASSLSSQEVLAQINNVSVVTSAKGINYMGLVGGGNTKKNAPNKSCRYGGPMYCNENKPLQKLTLQRTGLL